MQTRRQEGRMITERPWQRAGAALASDVTLLSFVESTSRAESTVSSAASGFSTPGFVTK